MIVSSDNKNVGGVEFKNFGSHSNEYPYPYLTAAAAIGITKTEIDIFIKRLSKILEAIKNKQKIELDN